MTRLEVSQALYRKKIASLLAASTELDRKLF